MTRWFDEFHKLSDEQLIEIPSDSEGEESPAGIDLENEPVREDTSQGNRESRAYRLILARFNY